MKIISSFILLFAFQLINSKKKNTSLMKQDSTNKVGIIAVKQAAISSAESIGFGSSSATAISNNKVDAAINQS